MKFSRINSSQQNFLLSEIQKILNEVNAHNLDIYDKSYWEWQYLQLPTKKSYVYAAWDKNKIVGYYHIPLYRCLIDGDEKLIGNIQDVAVDPKYRGLGLFRQLANFSNTDLNEKEVDLIYTFPNSASIKTFVKYDNFKTITTVPTYIRPINTLKIIENRIKLFGVEKIFSMLFDVFNNIKSKKFKLPNSKIFKTSIFDNEIETVFKKHSKQYKNHLIRDRLWLKWRYLDSKRGKHHILVNKENSNITGVLIVKEDKIFKKNALVIMDFAYLPGNESSLLFIINEIAKNNGIIGVEYDLIFTSEISNSGSHLKKIGFWKVPNRLNPRKLNFLSRSSSNLDERALLDKKDWLLTLGDWDVF